MREEVFADRAVANLCQELFQWCGSSVSPSLFEQKSYRTHQTGVFECGIDVVSDHVKREVVGPAECPDADSEKKNPFPQAVFGVGLPYNKERPGKNAQQQEQNAFGNNQSRGFDVAENHEGGRG